MLYLRKAAERGSFDHGWLQTHHTFSFGDYYDPNFMGFRTLRVINEDYVQSGKGFPTHSHRDMEIVTYILQGALEHKDSMGNTSVIRPGEVQRMSAGTGVTHSEFNASSDQVVHLLQIWILPTRAGIDPGYEQTFFSEDVRRNKLALVASQDGRDGSVTIHQDASIYASLLDVGQMVKHVIAAGRACWIQVAKGEIIVNDAQRLGPGDGLALSEEKAVRILGVSESEFLLFDLK